MRLMMSTFACAMVIGLAATTFAQTTAKPATTSTKTSTTAKQTTSTAATPKKAAAKPATVRANGKLTTFDSGSMMLTLATPKGSQQFMLTSTTKIEEGSKTIDGAALAKLTGHEVTVSYSEASGQKMVQSVHVSASAPKKS